MLAAPPRRVHKLCYEGSGVCCPKSGLGQLSGASTENSQAATLAQCPGPGAACLQPSVISQPRAYSELHDGACNSGRALPPGPESGLHVCEAGFSSILSHPPQGTPKCGAPSLNLTSWEVVHGQRCQHPHPPWENSVAHPTRTEPAGWESCWGAPSLSLSRPVLRCSVSTSEALGKQTARPSPAMS